MEFLVRLEDKVNTQVFCLNPVHKERVFYEDATFQAPCPECGSTEFLYRKNNAITKKGHFITFKPDGWSWGTNERKHFGIVRINCTEKQAKKWCSGIRNEQAETDAKEYEKQSNVRHDVIVTAVKKVVLAQDEYVNPEVLKEAVKEALSADTEYLTLLDNQQQAGNRAQIDYRPRKYSYDFTTELCKEL